MPPESVAAFSFSISFLCNRSFLGRVGLWLFMFPKSYSDMCDWYITASPLSTLTKASFICAFPARKLFISVPVSTIPASKVSPTKYSWFALRLRISVIRLSLLLPIGIKNRVVYRRADYLCAPRSRCRKARKAIFPNAKKRNAGRMRQAFYRSSLSFGAS